MAPITKKCGRDENDVRRPKKKVKRVKPIDYHSSSDESEVEGAAFDAPKEPKRENVIPVTGPNATPTEPRVGKASTIVEASAKPKSILKQTAPEVENEWVDNDSASEDEEVERNTAFNSVSARNGVEHDADLIYEDDGGWDSQDEADEPDNDEPDLASSDADSDEDSADAEADTESETSMTSSQAARSKKKRNDPNAFATSITKILDTKLTTFKRSDPVLSRSKSASEAHKTLADNKLEAKARAQIRAERKAALEKGRVKDVLGLEAANHADGGGVGGDVDVGALMEEEKRLKKTAQRGVVKLFNAVRAAQVKGEEAMRAARREGVVGMRQREERVNEMSKQGFLELISSGGKKGAVAAM